MLAVGHLALGYITGKIASRLLSVNVNISLLFFASILPDVDFLIPNLHRGPSHSLVVYAILFVPFFLLFGKKTIIYFVALFQHILLGDFLATGGMAGLQLLWPLSSIWYITPFYITQLTDIYLEWTFFLLSMALMLKIKDFRKLFEPHPLNLLLTVPVAMVVFPVFFGFPFYVRKEILIPHFVYLTLLTLSILSTFKFMLNKENSGATWFKDNCPDLASIQH